MAEYKFTPQTGRITTSKDLKVRQGAPNTSVGIVKEIKVGTELGYIGWVSDGENVSGNSKWFLDSEGNFFWAGNTEENGVSKILTKPLDNLVCTQKFGERPEFYKNYGSPKGHNGLDFRTKLENNPNDWKRDVYAVMDGVVLEAKEDRIKGKYIRLNHTNGHQSVYLHLSAILVSEAQKISAGNKIGISGNTGEASEAPHLHFGYRPINCDMTNGRMGYIDPIPYFIDEIKFV